MKTYQSITEIKEANREIGHHFFDRDTIRFFASHVSSKVLRGCFFITSEQFRGSDYIAPRKYSLRMVINNGECESVGKFNTRTRSECRDLLKALPDQFVAAYELAVNSYNAGKYAEFMKHALINKRNGGEIGGESFTGACAWLCQRENIALVDHCWLELYADLYEKNEYKPK